MNATKLARNLVRQLIELGVSDFVISPGSRNAPILLALSEAEKLQLVNLHSRLDERGAGYFALGIAKASNNFVAAVCTSGTAAANYLPALLEAYHSGAKLLLITADRPAKLRGTGANQTTYQDGLYSVIKSHDIATIIDLKNIVITGPYIRSIFITKLTDNSIDNLKQIVEKQLPDGANKTELIAKCDLIKTLVAPNSSYVYKSPDNPQGLDVLRDHTNRIIYLLGTETSNNTGVICCEKNAELNSLFEKCFDTINKEVDKIKLN